VLGREARHLLRRLDGRHLCGTVLVGRRQRPLRLLEDLERLWKGARYEWRQKTMEGCITNIGGCLKTNHPWIEVEMRANLAMTLNWNTKDLTITRVEI
jgi:hypothetical protein